VYKVMIVEDSKPILRNIKRQIEAANSRLQVSEMAYNGKEALTILEKSDIDIVITDIRMPRMDGLTFVQEAKHINPYAKYFLLSGYSDFEYARRAIKLNVCEYLLKPLDPKELIPILHRTIHELDNERKQQREEAASKLINPYISADTENQPIHNPYYSMHVIRNGHVKTDDRAWNREWLYQICNNIFPNANCLIADTSADSEKVILLGWEEDVNIELTNQLDAFFQRIASDINYVNMTSSSIENDPLKARSLYLSLSAHLDRHIPINGSGLYPIKEPFAPIESDHQDKSIQIKFHILIKNSQQDKFKDELEKLFAHYEQKRIPIATVKANLEIIRDSFAKYTMKEAIGLVPSEDEIESILSAVDSYTELVKQILKRFMPLFESIADQRSSMQDTFEAIDQFLRTNIYRQINMKELCQELTYSASYIIRIVKRYQGMTPVEYFNKLKIGEAKKLFDENESILIKNVAETLSFSDQHYFCKVFKQYTGCSPSEYKKHNLKNIE